MQSKRLIPLIVCLLLATSAPAAASTNALSAPAAFISTVVERILRETVSTEYEEMPGWGDQKRITVGAKIKTNDWKIRVEKRHKEVNHGLWKHYKVWLDDPDKNLKLRIKNLHRIEGSRFAFEAHLKSPLGGFARHAQWERGVQIYSVSAEATAKVEVRLKCEVAVRIVPQGYFLALAIEPKVTDVEIRLEDFDLRRVSKLSGKFAEELGDGLTDLIERKLTKREGKLEDKLNSSIAKRQETLILSPADLLDSSKEGWQSFLRTSPQP